MPKGDLGRSFEKLKGFMYIKYRGALILRDGLRFTVFGHKFDTEQQAKDEVDKAHKILENGGNRSRH